MNNKKIIFLITFAIVIIFIVMIISLAIVWNPTEKNVNLSEDGRKNVFSYVENTDYKDKTFNMYKSEVKRLLMPVNIKQLFKKLDDSYIKNNNFTEKNFEKYMKDNKLIANRINFNSYEVIENNDINIYRVSYNTLDNNNNVISINRIVNIIEDKPFSYTLSFESNSLDVLKKNVISEKEGIIFDVKNVINNIENTKFEIIMTNNNEENVLIDFDDVNNVTLILKDGREVRMAATVISAKDDILTKGSKMKKEAFFNVALEEQGKIKAIKFNKVKIGEKYKKIVVEF